MTNQEFNRELIKIRSILFSYTLNLTKNDQDARDLLQESSFRAFRYCSNFVMNTNFRAWMTAHQSLQKMIKTENSLCNV